MALPRRALTVLGCGLFGMGLAVGGFGTYVAELVARDFAPSVAGFGSTLFLFGQFVIVWPTDVLSRRRSVRLAATVGLGAGTVGTALGGSLSLPLAHAGRLLLGFGMGATFLASMTYAGMRADDGDVARTQGLLGATFTLGLAVGIAVTPRAVAAVGPVVPALAAAVPVAASALFAPSLQPVASGEPRRFRDYVDAFWSPSGMGLGLANAASYGLLIVATTWYTDVLSGVPALPTTLVLAGFATATFLGRTYSGWLTTVTTATRAVEGGLVFLAGTLGLVAAALWLGAPLLLAVALVLTGAGFGLPFGPLFSLAFTDIDADAGVLLVGMTAIGNVVALAYPWLVGQLLELTAGYTVGFVVLSLSTIVVVGVWRQTMGESEG
ncbi:MFS transporter [Haloarcula halophila]|uniref:MFS transporter n=1 Tax=Haloarcula TaxID=2237 RepID=UPI0023E43775|nr:MFS transporter [Halomicroarcula sp. DFY41]